MRKRLTRAAAAAAWLLLPALAMAGFTTRYDCYIYATSSDGVPITADEILAGEVYAAGNFRKDGDYGNYGEAAFEIDMLGWTLGATAHAHGVKVATYTFGVGTGRVESAYFEDRITFTTAAGTYPEGLYATLAGRFEGSLTSDVGAGVQCRCTATLGPETHDTGLLEIGIDDEGTIVVGEDFELVLELVPPGPDPQPVRNPVHTVRLLFGNGRTWSVEYNTGSGWITGDADFRFVDGLRFTSLTAPPGVTWTSDSGAFAGGVSGVPSAARPELRQNSPNPFNPSTVIEFTAVGGERHRLVVFDPAGHLIRTLFDGRVEADGHLQAVWDGRDAAGRPVASGAYVYRLEAGSFSETRTMTLVR